MSVSMTLREVGRKMLRTSLSGFSSSHVVLLVALAGCDGAIDAETRTAPDASSGPDAGSLPAGGCAATVHDLGGTDRGTVGGTGGSKGGILACDAPYQQSIVGIAIQMSNQATVFGGRSAQGIRIGCAATTIAADGSASVGAIATKEVSGDGSSNWSPSTWTALTQCDPGWVVTGLLAHRGTTDDLYVDVTITCGELLRTGGIGRTITKHVVGSQIVSANPSQVMCGSGEGLTRIGAFTGAGLDATTLYCSKLACE